MIVSPLFMYKLIFTAELLAGECLFCSRLARRDKFVWRAALSLVLIFAIAFALPILRYDAVWVSVLFLTIFAASVGAAMFCFDETAWNVLFCCVAAYIVQHFAYVLFDGASAFVADVFGTIYEFDPYSETGVRASGFDTFVKCVLYLIVYFLVYWSAYYVYASRIGSDRKIRTKLGKTRFVLLAGIVMLAAVLFSLISSYNEGANAVGKWLERGYGLLTCVLAMQLQFSQMKEDDMEDRLVTAQRILETESRQYDIIRSNIDVINVKCHDLKHMVGEFGRRNVDVDREELERIENAVDIYQSVADTGNSALDLILTDKSLTCRRAGIDLVCDADGARLAGVKPADIYVLFGNALDNAIEAVSDLPEGPKTVRISVRGVGNMTVICVENRFTRMPRMRDGLPRTTKEDESAHGFGMLSMKMIVERYGGNITVAMDGDVFRLNILFPERLPPVP